MKGYKNVGPSKQRNPEPIKSRTKNSYFWDSRKQSEASRQAMIDNILKTQKVDRRSYDKDNIGD